MRLFLLQVAKDSMIIRPTLVGPSDMRARPRHMAASRALRVLQPAMEVDLEQPAVVGTNKSLVGDI
jgi:hypothetical protein